MYICTYVHTVSTNVHAYTHTFSQNISSHPKSTSGSVSSSLSLAQTVPFPEYAGLLHCKMVRTKLYMHTHT